MSITLDTITLPDNCVWSDQLAWSGASATVKRTIQGKAIIQTKSIVGNTGRSITLGADNAWMPLADILTLQAWSGVAGKEMLLTLHDGSTFQVVFRLWDAPVIEAESVFPIADAEGTDTYNLTSLKLAAVA